ncbi:hypothetical protein [Paraburkholderia youngii]|uniref:hypothetical protein n=1 Tax=Paraburkholderia youngii TaxID=2782701 RepID=UPI003D1C46CA
MDHYSRRVREAILPLSVGKTLPNVFSEWSITERLIDHGKPCQTCVAAFSTVTRPAAATS